MAEERKRYCLVLDRTSIVAKSTMEFSEHVSVTIYWLLGENVDSIPKAKMVIHAKQTMPS